MSDQTLPTADFAADQARVDQAIAVMRGFVERFFADGKSTSMTPQLYVVGKHFTTGEEMSALHVLDVDLNEPEEKAAVFDMLGRKFWENNCGYMPIVAAFTSEAWLSSRRQSTVPHCQPRDDPARREVIVISAMDMPKKHGRAARFDVERNAKNGIVLGKFDGPTSGESKLVEGFFWGWAKAAQESFDLRRGGSAN